MQIMNKKLNNELEAKNQDKPKEQNDQPTKPLKESKPIERQPIVVKDLTKKLGIDDNTSQNDSLDTDDDVISINKEDEAVKTT